MDTTTRSRCSFQQEHGLIAGYASSGFDHQWQVCTSRTLGGYVSCVYHVLSYGYGELWSNDVLKPKFWTCSKQRVFHPGFDEVSADSIGESYPVLRHPLLYGFNDFDCFMLKRSFLFHNYGPGLNALKSLWMYSDIDRDRDVLFQMILMIGFNGKTLVWCGWKQMWMNNHKHITYIR